MKTALSLRMRVIIPAVLALLAAILLWGTAVASEQSGASGSDPDPVQGKESAEQTSLGLSQMSGPSEEPEIQVAAALGDPKLPPSVNVMPGRFIGFEGPFEPYTWVGRNMVVWGNVKNGTPPMTYEWTFGDGTPAASGAVANAKYIAVNHTYATSGIKRAVLTVTDNDGFTDRDTVIIEVVGTPTLKDSINASVEDGLRYLYNTQYADGHWEGVGFPIGATALGVLCFENQGYLPGHDWTKNIYAEYIQAGLNYVTARLVVQSIGLQTYCNPETDDSGNFDHNGLGIYPNTSYVPYEIGMVIMALVGSHDKGFPATTGPANVIGRSYYDIVVDLVDYCAWAENEAGSGRGGWRYYPNYGDADNSVSQWPAIGLEAAETEWGVVAPCVKSELVRWINTSRYGNGCFTYQPTWWPYDVLAVTGAGLSEMAYCDIPSSDPRVTGAMSCLLANWGNYYNKQFPYAMYAVKKGLEISVPNPIEDLDPGPGIFDWYSDYARFIIPRQNPDSGQFPMPSWGLYDHEWQILTLQPVVCLPEPVIAAPDTVGPTQAFVLDGSGSYHNCGTIVDWLWDFDGSDGFDFDSPDASGQIVTHPPVPLPAGQDHGEIVVALRVLDDNDPVRYKTTQKTIVVTRNCKAPVAVLVGPVAGHPGEVITLDGCGSYDPDALDPESECDDYIASYAWDFNGDGIFNDYPDSTTCTATNTWPEPTEGEVCLEVKDSFGKADTVCVPLDISPIDLDLQTNNIAFVPAGGTEGDVISIRSNITFDSEFDTTIYNVLIRFYDGDPSVSVLQIGPDQILASIDSGQSIMLQVNWTVPDLLPHDIYVVVDPLDAISEWDETNNKAFKTWVPTLCEEDRLVLIPWVQYEFYSRQIGPLTLDSICLWDGVECTWVDTVITVDPFRSYAWIGNFVPPYTWESVDTASVRINGVIQPHEFGSEFVGQPGSFPFLDQIFPGQTILRMRYNIPALVQYYIDSLASLSPDSLLWDEQVYPLEVQGQYTDGVPFELCGELILIGHRSGDVNNDGFTSVSDITFLIGYLFRGGSAPDPAYAGDVNHDGETSIADITRLVGIIFRGES